MKKFARKCMVILLTGVLLFGAGKSINNIVSNLYGIQPLSILDDEYDFF